MKKTILLLSIPLVVFALAGCGRAVTENRSQGTGSGRIKTAATIFPLFDIVRQVGGEKIEAALILPPGASPHTFEATPSQVKNAQGTEILFAIGGEVDAWAADIGNAITGVSLTELNRYLNLEPFGAEADTAAGGATTDLDPHTWLDPDRAAIMAARIAERLGQADPADRDYFEANARDFAARLGAKDREWRVKLENLDKKDLVVFHDAWGYFADHFGLRIAGAFEPFPGREPSPQYLARLEQVTAEYGVKALFVEPQFSPEALKTFVADLGVGLKVLDPLGGVPGRDSYIDLIDYNVDAVYEALK